MNTEFKGYDRIYQGGRSTEGWVRGAQIHNVNELVVGSYVICVNHSFESENLAIVVESCPNAINRWLCWVNVLGENVGENPFGINAYSLDPDMDPVEQCFVAERQTVLAQTEISTTLIIQSMFLQYAPGFGQNTAFRNKYIMYETLVEALRAKRLLEAEIKLMPAEVQSKLSVYLQDQNAPKEDALESLRGIAGYSLRGVNIKTIQNMPQYSYWQTFSEEQLNHYKSVGYEL